MYIPLSQFETYEMAVGFAGIKDARFSNATLVFKIPDDAGEPVFEFDGS